MILSNLKPGCNFSTWDALFVWLRKHNPLSYKWFEVLGMVVYHDIPRMLSLLPQKIICCQVMKENVHSTGLFLCQTWGNSVGRRYNQHPETFIRYATLPHYPVSQVRYERIRVSSRNFEKKERKIRTSLPILPM